MSDPTPVLVGADEVCQAVQATLQAHLAGVIDRLGQTSSYGPIKEWQQLPNVDALSSARFPAIAIESPGLTDAPVRHRSTDTWSATWRVAVGIYDRGRDHSDTQARVRNWCKFVRATLLLNRTLGGVAKGVSWSGEEYAYLTQQNQARTIGAGAVAIDVAVETAIDLSSITDLGLPIVQSGVPDLSITIEE